MKEFLKPNQTLRIDIIDWEDNYQGFVEFNSIRLEHQDYHCEYKSQHFEIIDENQPSLLYSDSFDKEDWYLVCHDRTVRIMLREFLGLRNFLVRTELADQNLGYSRFEITDFPTDWEDCRMQLTIKFNHYIRDNPSRFPIFKYRNVEASYQPKGQLV